MPSLHRAVTLALMFAVAPGAAHAGAWVLEPGGWYTEVLGSYYRSDTFRDNDGTRVPLPDGGVVERRTGLSYSEFGWRQNLSVHIGVPFTSVSRRVADGSVQETEAGLGDLVLGARYALVSGETAISVQTDFSAGMGYNRRLVPQLGPGSQTVSARLLAGSTIPGVSGFIEGGGGYALTFGRADVEKIPPAGPVTIANEAKALGAVVLEGNTGFWIGNSLLVAGRYAGRINLESVPDGSFGIDDDMLSAHLVGPVVLFRVDDHIDLMAGSMHTAAGERTLHADRYYVALSVKQSSLGRLKGFLGNKQ